MKPRARAGFTLIELLIAMVIIGILASFALAVLWRAKDRGYEAAMQSDLRSLVNEQEHYFNGNFTYASDIADLPEAAISSGVVVEITHGTNSGWAALSRHPSLGNRVCGIRVGDAPLSAATPAVETGFVQCTTE
jgi:prepilin-type N-terminal cleavage/methylation domain-containing protein